MSLFRTPLIVLDTETTGLLSDLDAQPWEIAAVLLDVHGAEVSHIELRGSPLVLRQDMARIIELGGMSADEVAALPSIAERVVELGDWLAAAPADARQTAFNIAFDRPMLARLGLRLEGWGPCVMEAAKRAMGKAGALPWYGKYSDYKMPKLSEAAAFYGVPQQEPAHRALADARTAAGIAIEIQRRALAAQASA